MGWERKGKEGGETEGRDLNTKGKEERKMRCGEPKEKETEEMGDEKGKRGIIEKLHRKREGRALSLTNEFTHFNDTISPLMLLLIL